MTNQNHYYERRTGEVEVAEIALEVLYDDRRAAAREAAERAASVAVRAPARAEHRLGLWHVLAVQRAKHGRDLVLHVGAVSE